MGSFQKAKPFNTMGTVLISCPPRGEGKLAVTTATVGVATPVGAGRSGTVHRMPLMS